MTGWTPKQINWDISYRTLMKMLNTIESPSEGKDNATPIEQFNPAMLVGSMDVRI